MQHGRSYGTGRSASPQSSCQVCTFAIEYLTGRGDRERASAQAGNRGCSVLRRPKPCTACGTQDGHVQQPPGKQGGRRKVLRAAEAPCPELPIGCQ